MGLKKKEIGGEKKGVKHQIKAVNQEEHIPGEKISEPQILLTYYYMGGTVSSDGGGEVGFFLLLHHF